MIAFTSTVSLASTIAFISMDLTASISLHDYNLCSHRSRGSASYKSLGRSASTIAFTLISLQCIATCQPEQGSCLHADNGQAFDDGHYQQCSSFECHPCKPLRRVSLRNHVFMVDLAAMHRIIAITGKDLHSRTNGQSFDDGH